MKSPGDILIKYKFIDSAAKTCSINETPIKLADLDNLEGLENIEKPCCCSYLNLQKEYVICTASKIRCHREKKIMVKYISYWCNYKFKYPSNSNGDHEVEETFEYGVDRVNLYNEIVAVGLAKDIVDME